MRVQLRIVAGSLRGRKLNCDVSGKLRPAPQMVREALFSILGNAVPERTFYDLFAGTGAVGLEALSRGASNVVFLERDHRHAARIEDHIEQFEVGGKARVIKADVYRYVERWQPGSAPVNVFLGPPFIDLTERFDDLMSMVESLQDKLPAGSVIVLQTESNFGHEQLPDQAAWDIRRYGRNMLYFWVKEVGVPPSGAPDGD